MGFFSGAGRPRWPDYRAVWRWHFYAGLFCIPFVLVLSLSGAVYLFKAELEAWSERAYDQLETTGAVAPVGAQIGAALEAFRGARLEGYELPQAEQAAARVIVRQGGEAVRVYVHPRSLAVLGSVAEAGRLMKTVFRLHGELLLGKRGSMLVELAASWTIVLILTGLVLWWPRHSRGAGGV
ncbi:MAG: PepSY domain-containing protein, partial [Planctomycetota bacterium]